MNFVTGEKAIDRALSVLQNGLIAKMMRPAMTAGLKASTKAMKAAVPANLKDAKKGIGWRFNKSQRNGELMAKAGAAVGMKSAKIKKQIGTQFIGRVGRPGVGISARNIMWFILGTKNRQTSSGKNTGSMPSQMNPIRDGFSSSSAQVLQIISDATTKCLLKLIK